MTRESTLYCSFCGKSQHEVAKLIQGPRVVICDECIFLCVDIMLEPKIGGLSAQNILEQCPPQDLLAFEWVRKLYAVAFKTSKGERSRLLRRKIEELEQEILEEEEALTKKQKDKKDQIESMKSQLKEIEELLDKTVDTFRAVPSQN